MDKLSLLLKEAKPLYKRRKRTKLILQSTFVALIPIFVFSFALEVYKQGDNIYLSLDNNNLQYELLEDDLGLLR